MATISRDELLRLARSGAVARVNELQTELELIYATFPDLRSGAVRGRAAKASKAVAAAPAAKAAKKGQASRAWSSAARKAVSERMKKYWAARRAKTAKASK